MKSSLRMLAVVLAVAVAVLVTAGPSSTQPMTDLGTLRGDESEAVAINNSFNGSFQVASNSNIPPRLAYTYAVLWKDDFPLPQPEKRMQDVEDDVQDLVESATIEEGRSNSLNAKLEAVKNTMGKGRTQVSCSVLQTFINQVETMLSAGWMSPAEAQALIDEANSMMFELRC